MVSISTRRRLGNVALVTIAAALLALTLWGHFRPSRVTPTSVSPLAYPLADLIEPLDVTTSTGPRAEEVNLGVTIQNQSTQLVYLRRFGESSPGLRLIKTSSWSHQAALAPQRRVDLWASFLVTNCQLLARDPTPVTFEFRAFGQTWKTTTLTHNLTPDPNWYSTVLKSACPAGASS